MEHKLGIIGEGKTYYANNITNKNDAEGLGAIRKDIQRIMKKIDDTIEYGCSKDERNILLNVRLDLVNILEKHSDQANENESENGLERNGYSFETGV